MQEDEIFCLKIQILSRSKIEFTIDTRSTKQKSNNIFERKLSKNWQNMFTE